LRSMIQRANHPGQKQQPVHAPVTQTKEPTPKKT
jgi:hypothetical protein